jgi:N-acetylmuramoyl-L-alanine amidase
MRAIKEIILHCSATPEGRDVSAVDIDRWHRERGFNKIGYHYVIRLDGTIETGRAIGEVGAHCVGHNTGTIGICYVGGCTADGKRSKDTRTNKQKAALYDLLKRLVAAYPTITRITGHRQYANKDCPCFDATAEYGEMAN